MMRIILFSIPVTILFVCILVGYKLRKWDKVWNAFLIALLITASGLGLSLLYIYMIYFFIIGYPVSIGLGVGVFFKDKNPQKE